MPEQDEIDNLINSALSDYAEPRTGLEQRMLARLSGEALRPRMRGWVLLAIAIPAFAALMLIGYLVPWNLRPQQGQVVYTPAVPSTGSSLTVPAPRSAPKVSAPRHTQNRDQIVHRASKDKPALRPKLDVFPTPGPLNAEEQVLVQFVEQVPEADRKALVEAQQRVDEPLNIAAIRIPPLQSPEENH